MPDKGEWRQQGNEMKLSLEMYLICINRSIGKNGNFSSYY